MKNIKNYIKLLLFSAILFTTSCSLDEELPGVAITSQRFQNETDATAAINGIMAIMSDYSYYKEQWWYTLMLTADDLHQAGSNSDAMGNSALTLKTYKGDLVNISKGWYYMYRAIDASNLCIQKIPTITGDSLKKEQLLGEAYFLRAMNYFNVVRYFGKGIVSLEPVTGLTNMYKPFQSKDSIYKIIESDLLAAAKRLPLAKSANAQNGRPAKGAAQGILSLVYLTQEKWQLAANYADSVILSNQYSLIKDYAQLWNVEKENINTEENIFSIQYARDNTTAAYGSLGSVYAYMFCPNNIQFNTGLKGASATDPITGTGNAGGLRVHCYFFDEYFYDYDLTRGGKQEYATTTEKDYRIDKSFFYGTWPGTGQNKADLTTYGKPVDAIIYPGGKGNTDNPAYTTSKTNFNSLPFPMILKYRDGNGVDSRNQGNDLIILRLAEVYLIKAEAANELGKTTDSYTAFNKVRERARLANSTSGGAVRTVPKDLAIGLSKEQFRIAILKERGLELIAEGHRWFDLVRMKMNNGQTMYEYRFSTAVNKQPFKKVGVATENSLRSLPSLAYFSKNILFPIPTEEFDKNTAVNLSEQNPGY